MTTPNDAFGIKAAIEKILIANENKVLDAFPKKDIATLKTLIADDAWPAPKK